MMFTQSIGLCALALSVPSACLTSESTEADAILFHGGTIRVEAQARDGEEARTAQALLCRDGKVVALDSEALRLAERSAGSVERYDLRGATAVPGLQDAHGHVFALGGALSRLDLGGVESFEELIQAVERRAEELAPGEWILGRGWDQTRWSGGEFPHHRELSKRVPNHPLLLRRVDGHAALANQLALAAVGWDGVYEKEPEVPGGRVLLDEAGHATGVLIDNAIDAVDAVIPDMGAGSMKAALLDAQSAVLASGLTMVHEMGAAPEWLSVLAELARAGEWKLGMRIYLWGNDGLSDDVLSQYPADLDDEGRLRVVGVKLMADGALGSRGAALLEDYHDDESNRGLLLVEPERLKLYLHAAAASGLQPAIHAIGDRANRQVLDAYDDLSSVADLELLRPRLEHAQVLAAGDFKRVRALHVIPSVQPTHATSDMRWAEERLGPERVRGAYAWHDLDPELDRLALGSDFPVESVDPLLGIYAARTRQDAEGDPAGGFQPEQRLDGLAALRGFTQGAAWAVREEGERGKLLPGYACDMTVLDIDPVTCLPSALLTGRCLATVVAGELVYRAE